MSQKIAQDELARRKAAVRQEAINKAERRKQLARQDPYKAKLMGMKLEYQSESPKQLPEEGQIEL